MSTITFRSDEETDRLLKDLSGGNGNRSQIIRDLIKESKEGISPYREMGTSGLSRFGGSIREERLRELRGASGRRLYQEARQNYAVMSAVFFAIEMILRQVRFFAESVSDEPGDREAAEFLDQCLLPGTFIQTMEVAGQGKCLRNGVIPIEEITTDTLVVTHRGRARKVTKLFQRAYSGRLYSLRRAYSNEEVVLTPNHPLLVRRKERRRRRVYEGNPRYRPLRYLSSSSYEWVMPSEVEKGDFLVEPIDTKIQDVDSIDLTPYCSDYMLKRGWYNSLKRRLEISPELMRFLGYFLAEGSASIQSGQTRLTIGESEQELLDDLVGLVKTCFGLNVSIVNVEYSPARRVVINSPPITRFLSEHFRPGGIHSLPMWARRLPKEKVAQLLYGLLRGDAHFAREHITLTVQERNFAEQIRHQFLRLGIVPSFAKCPGRVGEIQGQKFNSKPHYLIKLQGEHARTFASLIGFEYGKDFKHRARSCAFTSRGYAHYPIRKIVTREDTTTVYNLEVTQDHSYIANNVAVHNCLGDMSFSWNSTLQFVLTMLEQGFSLLELVYKKRHGQEPKKPESARSRYDDGRIGWRKWAPRPAASLAPGKEWVFDEHGGIRAINQLDPAGQRNIPPIPIEKLLLFRTTVAPANSPEGIPIHRGCYIEWYFANNLREIMGIGVERDLAGLPVMYLGDGCSLDGANSDYEMAKDLVVNIRRDEQEGIVIPGTKMGAGEGKKKLLLELLSTAGGRQFDIIEILNYFARRIAMSVLAQWMMLGMERVGSYALSSHQGNFFDLAVAAWADIIIDVINAHAVPRLFALNTFNVKELPRITHSAVGVTDLKSMALYINALVGSQVIAPDANLERYLREMAGLPAKMELIEIQEPVEEVALSVVEKQDKPLEARQRFREDFQDTYSQWLAQTAIQLEEAPEEDRAGVLEAALVGLAVLLKSRLRSGLESAFDLGLVGQEASAAALMQLEAKIEEGEGYIGIPPTSETIGRFVEGETRRKGDPLLLAIARKLWDATKDPMIIAGGALALIMVGETLISRIVSYGGLWWQGLLMGWGATAKGDERVQWILDDTAAHCTECPSLAGEYTSWDALPKLPGETECDGNCRCRIAILRGGQWVWI